MNTWPISPTEATSEDLPDASTSTQTTRDNVNEQRARSPSSSATSSSYEMHDALPIRLQRLLDEIDDEDQYKDNIFLAEREAYLNHRNNAKFEYIIVDGSKQIKLKTRYYHNVGKCKSGRAGGVVIGTGGPLSHWTIMARHASHTPENFHTWNGVHIGYSAGCPVTKQAGTPNRPKTKKRARQPSLSDTSSAFSDPIRHSKPAKTSSSAYKTLMTPVFKDLCSDHPHLQGEVQKIAASPKDWMKRILFRKQHMTGPSETGSGLDPPMQYFQASTANPSKPLKKSPYNDAFKIIKCGMGREYNALAAVRAQQQPVPSDQNFGIEQSHASVMSSPAEPVPPLSETPSSPSASCPPQARPPIMQAAAAYLGPHTIATGHQSGPSNRPPSSAVGNESPAASTTRCSTWRGIIVEMRAYPGDPRRRLDWDLLLHEDFTAAWQKHWTFPLPNGGEIIGPLTVDLEAKNRNGSAIVDESGVIDGYWPDWHGLVEEIKRKIDGLLRACSIGLEDLMGPAGGIGSVSGKHGKQTQFADDDDDDDVAYVLVIMRRRE
ncbi:uncharacterized protein AB675_7742 [Cyphellophora attinorum]|uniref:Uncharacterized protein n=1 Tax=Cyphellophora attinorum TaxID=1664694 RepID=A0A0N1P0K9_9EURO|nr:uncharacterized protein AB675_7742 [Phialophora attinorum]KPI40525.1 hypothetical protein AB675_7742 [Phialophora attinorum]